MRVLILSQYYYPEPVDKVCDLATGLQQLGHEVQVLTSFPCYPTGKLYPGYHQMLWKDEMIDGVRVTRIPQIPDHSESVWKRALYYLSFALSAAILGTWRARPANVILVYQSALPTGFGAIAIGRLRHIPVVLDVVDIWPESVSASGMLQAKWILRLLRKAAHLLYSQAAHINVVTDGFRRNLLRLGVPSTKLSVIHNWVPADVYHAAPRDPEMARRFGITGRFVVMYGGAIGLIQNLRTVLDTVSLLPSDLDVQFVFIGDGAARDELRAEAKRRGLSNVVFLGQQPSELMPSFFALADVLLVHLKKATLSELSIPSKTFAYMACGRPILMAVAGEASRFVKANQCGVAVPPDNPNALAEAICSLVAMPVSERELMGLRGAEAYAQQFAAQLQIRRMSEVLEAAGIT